MGLVDWKCDCEKGGKKKLLVILMMMMMMMEEGSNYEMENGNGE